MDVEMLPSREIKFELFIQALRQVENDFGICFEDAPVELLRQGVEQDRVDPGGVGTRLPQTVEAVGGRQGRPSRGRSWL